MTGASGLQLKLPRTSQALSTFETMVEMGLRVGTDVIPLSLLHASSVLFDPVSTYL